MRSTPLLFIQSTLVVLALAAAFVLGAGQPTPASGAVNRVTGDILRTITVTPALPDCILPVGLAFDGSELLVANCTDSNVITRVNPADGSVLGQITTNISTDGGEGLGAISWDENGQQLWIGTRLGRVYSAALDKAAGTAQATLRFTPAEIVGHGLSLGGEPNNLIDGLSVDPADGSLWLGPDQSVDIFHYSQDGTLLASFVTAIGGATNVNGHSGIEVADADTLYAANAAGGSLFCVTKDGSTQGRLADPTLTLEDIEVDDVTFAPRRVVWVRDTIDRNRLRAVEIVPAPCVQGATPGPTSVPAPPAVAGATPQPAPAPGGALDAKVEIVFPHDAAGNPIPVENLTQAPLVNVGSFIFNSGTLDPVPCGFNNPVRLFRATNTDPSQFVAVGTPRQIQQGGNNITIWDFNDVDVSAAADPLNKYYFTLSVDGTPTNTNVWSHGADARTIFPQQDVPSGVGPLGASVDAKVEIVFPHDAAGNPIPVENLTQAPLVNIEAAIFAAGTLQSAPPDANLTVRLFSSLNNDPQREIAVGQRVIRDIGGLQQPRWVFNDVDVSQAQDPLNKYYFRVSVDGIATNSNVWSHGADARTIFPQVDTPSRSCQ